MVSELTTQVERLDDPGQAEERDQRLCAVGREVLPSIWAGREEGSGEQDAAEHQGDDEAELQKRGTFHEQDCAREWAV